MDTKLPSAARGVNVEVSDETTAESEDAGGDACLPSIEVWEEVLLPRKRQCAAPKEAVAGFNDL